tara:strand:- start:319 stop:687 length:369 start_codon:yes stop_codon:yes gene_type:complete
VKKKYNRKQLIRKLDTELSLYIRERDKYCVICGTTYKLTNGHLFSRRSHSTRWDYQEDGNCHTQCLGCNFSHVFDPYPYNSFYIEKFGKNKWDELHFRFRGIKKYKNFELAELLETIKELRK